MRTMILRDRFSQVRPGGSIYIHVLASSLLVTIIGLGALAAVRVEMRSARLTRDYGEARACAVSAVELGLLHVRQDPGWRTTWSSGTWLDDKALGAGHFTLLGIDPQDNLLGDSESDPLVLTGIGTRGIARHKAQVMLVPVIEPLEALNTCLHASGLVQVKAGKQIIVVGAPVSTNALLDNDGTIDGNAEAQSVGHTGTITGTLTVPAPSKRMPDTTVISEYISRATVVPYTGTIDKAVLTPACNPWGPTDPNGLYVLDTGGNDLIIKNSRIHGTLIVVLGSKTLTLDSAVFCQSYRSDAPVLLVQGDTIIKCSSADTVLSESVNGTNYNPAGAPYEGFSDGDVLDEYPNEIRGLVHVSGTLRLQQTARIVGAVICNGEAYAEETNTIIHDAGLYACPPDGYTYVSRMKISPHSWKQVVD